jgi:hypothetical protein
MEVNIFTNMPSLLNPTPAVARWPLSLVLPQIDFVGYLQTMHPQSTNLKPSLQKEAALAQDFLALQDTQQKKPRKARRRTKAWLCKHIGRSHYAKGICQFCYLKRYHAARKAIAPVS